MNKSKTADNKSDIDYAKGIGEMAQYRIYNSDSDDVCQGSDSDLLDFKKFEKDVYADAEISSDDELHSLPLPSNNNNEEEVTDSLRLVLPKITIMPSLGNPIETYDQLREQYTHNTPSHPIPFTSDHDDTSQANHTGNSKFQYTQKINSRANENVDQVESVTVEQSWKNRQMKNSQTSTESNVRQSGHRSQKMLLEKERSIRLDQDKYINHLQHTINQLLTKHALAEETIDQLRLGVVINTKTRYDRRPTTSVKKRHPSRRYSSIVDNANIRHYDEESKYLSRAKSVDLAMFDDGHLNNSFSQQRLSQELGGSMKQMRDSYSPKNTDLANDARTIGEYFQSRIRILTEASTTIQYNSSGRTSVSSGSRRGQVVGSETVNQTPIAKRLKDLQMAFDDLQTDFNGFQQINRNRKPEFALLSDVDVHDIEGDLFQLGMKIDDLERSIGDGRVTPTNNNSNVLGTVAAVGNVEDEYRCLIDRYNTLKGSRTPTGQKSLDEVVQQLQHLVKRVNGLYDNVPTPDQLESMMQQDIIDKIKQNMSLSSPQHSMTTLDGNCSPNNDPRRRQAYRISRPDLDSDFKSQSDDVFVSMKSLQEDNRPFSLPVTLCHGTERNDSVSSTFRESVPCYERGSVNEKGLPGDNNYHSFRLSNNGNGTKTGIASSERCGTSDRSSFHDDFNRLDKQLEKLQLNEQRHWLAADEALSRATRSILCSSTPTTTMQSRLSKPPSSISSSHKSSEHWTPSDNGRKKRTKKMRISSKFPISEDDWDSDESLKAPSRGPVLRGREAMNQNMSLQDGWSQTNPIFDRRATEKEFRSETDDPYIDDVAYWTGDSFQPSREHLPTPPVRLRPRPRQPKNSSRAPIRQEHRTRSLYVPTADEEEDYMLPRSYRDPTNYDHRHSYNSHYTEAPVSREYYPMEPHRYLVKEYGQRSRPVFDPPIHDDDYSDDDEDSSSHDNYLEERRMRSYLDEAVIAAQSMRRYTKRISDLCQKRRLEDDRAPPKTSQRLDRDIYAQYR